jgi:6-phosphofructokinase 1
MNVHKIITANFPGWRGEFQITESLPMSAADRAVKIDLAEAFKLGAEAVKLAAKGVTGKMVTLVRGRGAKYSASIGTADLSDVAAKAKPMPDSMITPDGFFVTKAFYDYAAPLVGPLPKYTNLKLAAAKSPVKSECGCGCGCGSK